MTHLIDLNEAVEAGIISLDQAKSLEAMGQSYESSSQTAATGAQDDESSEPFRLIGGFNDIFVTIGIVLLLVGAYIALLFLYDGFSMVRPVVMAVMIWCLAEYISRIKRMKLPSTVLSLGFMASIGALVVYWLQNNFTYIVPQHPEQTLELLDQVQLSGLIVFATFLGAALIYLWRFRVPIQAAFMALAVAGIITVGFSEILVSSVVRGEVIINDIDDLVSLFQRILLIPLFCGVCIFAVGIYLDYKDRMRQTTLSDSAFWLHLVSAPMLVHPLFMLASGEDMFFFKVEPGIVAQVGLFVIVMVIVLISLAIDRRALLIPTLAYFGSIGIYRLIANASDATGIPALALVLLVVGALIILLGIGWHKIRKAIIGRILPASWLALLPPLKSA